MTAAHLELKRLKDAMKLDGLDAVLLSEPASICYASGFEMPLPLGAGADFAGGPNLALIGPDSDDILLVAETERSKAEKQNGLRHLHAYSSYGFFAPLDARDEFRRLLRRAIEEVVSRNGSTVLGVEMRTLPLIAARLLESEFPNVELREAVHTVDRARKIKTPHEIERIRKSAAANDAGQEALRTHLSAGMSEIDLWGAMVNHSEREAGHFVPVVGELVSGPRTAILDYPGGPLGRAVEEGDTVICDYSVVVDGYWSDTTNTLVVGRPSAEQRRLFDTALRAYEAARDTLKPGVRALDVAEAAHRVIRQAGFEPVHHMGHQIGTSAHEHPGLVCHDQEIIEPGMVFCLEPGVYGGEGGTTGARVEKMFLVTETGAEVLNHFQWGIE